MNNDALMENGSQDLVEEQDLLMMLYKFCVEPLMEILDPQSWGN
jgi:hypothetical protein